jgi:hypothetical protein
MILKNYWTILNDITTKANAEDSIYGNITDITGTDRKYNIGGNNSTYAMKGVISNANMKGDISCRLGTGTTDPTINDFSLVTDVTTCFTGITVQHSTVVTDNGAKVVYVISGTNNISEDITIREVGITKGVKYGSSSSPSTFTILLTRDVLASPITVPAGQGFAFTYEWVEG